MELFSPTGHREALETHSLNLIQSMFVPLEGEESRGEEKGADPLCLHKKNETLPIGEADFHPLDNSLFCQSHNVILSLRTHFIHAQAL